MRTVGTRVVREDAMGFRRVRLTSYQRESAGDVLFALKGHMRNLTIILHKDKGLSARAKDELSDILDGMAINTSKMTGAFPDAAKEADLGPNLGKMSRR